MGQKFMLIANPECPGAQINDARVTIENLEHLYANVKYVPNVEDVGIKYLVGAKIVALRAIKPGEQLLMAYGSEYWKAWEQAEKKKKP